MFDMEMAQTINDINNAWKYLSNILDKCNDAHSLMFTINARYFNAIKHADDKEFNQHMKEEYIRLLNEKFGE